jgi:hypothetical protein
MPGKDCLQKYPTFPADPADLSPTNYVALKFGLRQSKSQGRLMPKRLPKCCAATRSTRCWHPRLRREDDVTGIEMWSWYRWENGTVVEKAPSELPPTEKPIWGLLFFSVFPYQKKKLGRGLRKSAAKTG